MTVTYNSSPTTAAASLLTYTAPSPKLCLQSNGFYSYQAHNLCLQSEDFTNAAWVKTRVTATSSTVIEDTSNNTHLLRQSLTIIPNATYTMSADILSTSTRRAVLRMRDALVTGSESYAIFNPADGSVTATGSSTWLVPTTTSTPITGGYRVSITVTLTGSGATVGFDVALADSSNQLSYLGDGSSFVAATRIQVSRSPAAPTYLQTTTTARYDLPYEWNASGQPLGIRVESARTNVALRSAMTAGAVSGTPGTAPTGWTFGGSGGTTTVSATGGLTNNGFLTQSVSGAARQFIIQTIATTDATTNNFRLEVNNVSGGLAVQECILVISGSSTVGSTSYQLNGTTVSGATLIPAGRNTLQFTFTATGTGNVVVRGGVGVAGNTAGAASIDLLHAQFESGSVATSAIETFGSTVTRAADNISLATSAFPYNAANGILVAQYISSAIFGTTAAASLTDGTSANRILLRAVSSGAAARAVIVTGGASQADQNANGGTPVAGTVYKLGGTYAANDFATTVNGGTVSVDTAGTVPTVTTLQLGNENTGSHLDGWLQSILYLPRNRTSNAELQLLTTV